MKKDEYVFRINNKIKNKNDVKNFMFQLNKKEFMKGVESKNEFVNLEMLEDKKGRGYFFIDTLIFGGIKRKDENHISL